MIGWKLSHVRCAFTADFVVVKSKVLLLLAGGEVEIISERRPSDQAHSHTAALRRLSQSKATSDMTSMAPFFDRNILAC